MCEICCLLEQEKERGQGGTEGQTRQEEEEVREEQGR
jgi:hypothetical protein